MLICVLKENYFQIILSIYFTWSFPFHCSCQYVDVGNDGADLQHFSSHCANTIVLSNFTRFDGGSDSFEQKHPLGTSTFVDDRFPLSIC